MEWGVPVLTQYFLHDLAALKTVIVPAPQLPLGAPLKGPF